MDTIVENFGFFVEGCHVPPVKYVIWLLGMEPTHLTDRVIWTCPIYNLPFNRKSFLLLLKLPNIHTKCCSCLVFWIYHICSMLVVSVSKILCATNICFNFITRCNCNWGQYSKVSLSYWVKLWYLIVISVSQAISLYLSLFSVLRSDC